MFTSVKDIAWVAGILEGEGSFGFTNNGRSPAIWLGMTDVDIVERVRNLVDRSKSISITKDQRKESYKDSYHVTMHGSRAIGWLMTIYPLMGIRRRVRIRELLEIWKNVELVQNQVRDNVAHARQSLSFRLRRSGYSKLQIETAKYLQSSGFTDEQILLKLEDLKGTIN